MRTLRSHTISIFSALLLLSQHALGAGPGITKLTKVPNDARTVEAALNENISSGPTDSKDCKLRDMKNGRSLTVASCTKGTKGDQTVDITIGEKEHFDPDPDASYLVVFKNLRLTTSGKVDILTNVLPIAKLSVQTAEQLCVFSKFQQLLKGDLDPADDRDSSDLYFSGLVSHSRGGQFQGTYDLKADLSGRCKTGNRLSLFGPSLDLKGGNDPNGDPDSLNFSWLWNIRISPDAYPKQFGFVRLDQKATLESTEDFAQRNIVYSAELRNILRPWALTAEGTARVHFYPTLGVEAGKNIRGIIPAVDGKNIARAKVGTSALVIFDIDAKALQNISFDTTYARRWPLIPEVTFKKTDSGFQSVNIGTGPRDYVKEKMKIGFTKYLGASVSYEYGSLPPKFSFVDSKFTFGLDVSAAFK